MRGDARRDAPRRRERPRGRPVARVELERRLLDERPHGEVVSLAPRGREAGGHGLAREIQLAAPRARRRQLEEELEARARLGPVASDRLSEEIGGGVDTP